MFPSLYNKLPEEMWKVICDWLGYQCHTCQRDMSMIELCEGYVQGKYHYCSGECYEMV
jgi:hypothetical protein